jgi:hypothetical protein
MSRSSCSTRNYWCGMITFWAQHIIGLVSTREKRFACDDTPYSTIVPIQSSWHGQQHVSIIMPLMVPLVSEYLSLACLFFLSLQETTSQEQSQQVENFIHPIMCQKVRRHTMCLSSCAYIVCILYLALIVSNCFCLIISINESGKPNLYILDF